MRTFSIHLVQRPASKSQIPKHKNKTGVIELVPDWLFHSLRKRFRYPDRIKREEITMMKINMKPRDSKSEQIAAFINVDMVNAVFVIFEKHGDHYDEVYCKDLFVESVKVIGAQEHDQKIVLTGGGGGTGIWESSHYVIRYTPEGYKDVWEGVATLRVSDKIAPYDIQQNGTIGFDAGGNELYYALIKSQPVPEVSGQIYKYNENRMKYGLAEAY